MTDRIEAQVERFAPGFRDRILARSALGPRDLERHNPNLAGGDIAGGRRSLLAAVTGRRVGRSPYATPVEGLFVCSAATSPGPGVHGMCGHLAASAVLSRLGGPV
jgi:phytoene dehydrogenase-like protein